jgi:hypothetical protein
VNGAYRSAGFTGPVHGTYRWVITCSGDAMNAPFGPTTCGDPAETSTVSATPNPTPDPGPNVVNLPTPLPKPNPKPKPKLPAPRASIVTGSLRRLRGHREQLPDCRDFTLDPNRARGDGSVEPGGIEQQRVERARVGAEAGVGPGNFIRFDLHLTIRA